MAHLNEAERILPELVRIRREIHAYPELAFEEIRTAERILSELGRLGLSCQYGGGGTGVIARLSGDGPADTPTVALRAEMDALPGQEKTGLPFSSRIDGRMHACGHDAHIAMVLGAANLLSRNPPKGQVIFVFQPAEEEGGGSREVIRTGALKKAKAIFAGHVTNQYRVGEIMVDHGTVTAQSDRFSVRINGKGGHGARPHEGVDAVVIASSFVNAVQLLVAREVNPVYPAVITIGRMEAGSAANVIAEFASLEGTIRSTRPEVRMHLHRGIRRMASALEELHGARIEIGISEGYPPVVNTPDETEMSLKAAGKVLGLSAIRHQEHPSMGAEDFSYYLEELSGCFVRLGSRADGAANIPLHSPAFDIDERVIAVGAAYYDEVVRESLRRMA